MTSDLRSPDAPRPVYVWTWLAGATEPVVAGVLAPTGDRLGPDQVLAFRYAASYRARPNAISLYTPELPLTSDIFDPRLTTNRDPLPMAGCLRDASPDAWGRRVINLRMATDPDHEFDETTYLLHSGSNRIGALDFHDRPDQYAYRDDGASLMQLLELAELVESGAGIPDSLLAAAQHGTSIGGARPKALLRDGDRQCIVKFPSTTDDRPVVKAEAVAMLLAASVGIDVAAVEVQPVNGRDVLVVERFDRRLAAGLAAGPPLYTRLHMVSMLTVLGVSEMHARYSSYADMAANIRAGAWTRVPETLRELFTRLVFNVCVGNSDDHLRNHSAFWDGRQLELTPAYDLSPQVRNTDPASHAVGIVRDGPDRSASQLRLCRAVAPEFLLRPAEAEDIISHVRTAIVDGWTTACDRARLTKAERDLLWGREFMNPYIDYDEA